MSLFDVAWAMAVRAQTSILAGSRSLTCLAERLKSGISLSSVAAQLRHEACWVILEPQMNLRPQELVTDAERGS